MDDVSRLLAAIDRGDPGGAGQLLALVYDDLRRLAERKLARERPGQTLQATALVHDAYLRLVGDAGRPWDGRGHFFAAAAEAMRRILVERARRVTAEKRGGGRDRVTLGDVPADDPGVDLLALDEALADLAAHDEVAARLVTLRFFGGLGHQEAAESLGLGRRAADRLWAFARAWLYERLAE